MSGLLSILSARRLRFSVVALAFFCVSALCADGGMLVPREVFVGDTAEFSFATTSFNAIMDDGSVEIIPSGDFPVSANLTIESIVIARQGDNETVTIRFVPWTAGIIKIPSITLKKKTASPPPLRISSIVEKTGRKALEPARAPLLVPGTTLLIYILIAILVAAVAVLIFAGVRIQRFLSGLSTGLACGRRVRTLNRELIALSRSIRKKEALSWYGDFSSVVRRYLGDIAAGNPLEFLPYTVTEILSATQSAPCFHGTLGSEFSASLRDFLYRLDTVRFSGHQFDDTRAEDIRLIRDFSATLESAAATAPLTEAAHA